MMNGGKRIGFYAAGGVMIAVLMIAGVFLSGVPFPGVGGVEGGMLVVLLKDAPANLSSLYVTIDSFSVQSAEDAWVDIPFSNGEPEVYFDLLMLYDVAMELGTAKIGAGDYTKMRMTVKSAEATFAGEKPLVVDLTVPPGHVDIIIHFEVKADDVTSVLIDMEADWVAISKNNHLRPVFKAEVAS